jgi:hypothetical protein
MPFAVSLKLVQVQSRGLHVFNFAGLLKHCQDQPQTLRMYGLYA